MSLDIGMKYKATIRGVEFMFDPKGQPYLNVTFHVPEESQSIDHRMYLTEKSLGIARFRLKSLGFDVDKRTMEEIANNSQILNGAETEIEIGEYVNRKGEAIPQVVHFGPPNEKPKKSLLDSITKGLREAKHANRAAPSGDAPTEEDPF